MCWGRRGCTVSQVITMIPKTVCVQLQLIPVLVINQDCCTFLKVTWCFFRLGGFEPNTPTRTRITFMFDSHSFLLLAISMVRSPYLLTFPLSFMIICWSPSIATLIIRHSWLSSLKVTISGIRWSNPIWFLLFLFRPLPLPMCVGTKQLLPRIHISGMATCEGIGVQCRVFVFTIPVQDFHKQHMICIDPFSPNPTDICTLNSLGKAFGINSIL